MNSNGRRSAGLALAACVGALGAAGCQYVVNPFVDGTQPASTITTPTAVAAAEAVPKAPTMHERDWEPQTRYYPKSGVNHWPLWWEDPFEDKGSGNAEFAWTGEDYIAMPYGWARWLLNTTAWPISAIVTPPFTIMSSDGYLSKQLLGYDHDARIGAYETVEIPPPLRGDDESESPAPDESESPASSDIDDADHE